MGLSTVSGAVVAVIGSGGRETCLAWKLAQSPVVRAVSLVPGNAYTGSRSIDKVSNGDFTLDVQDPASFNEFTKWCKHNEVNLVVVGPEAPLAAGIVDYLNDAGIECFGPTQAAAELEWNKEFAKKCFDRAKIPTARWKAFTDPHQAEEFINTAPFDALVIKANGLAAGKGVVVAGTKEEACNEVRAFLDGHRFGSAGSTIVVEEKLVGPEVSILCFTDGKDVFPMPAAQDAKRVGEGDSGSNTGGMGAYAPVHPSILSEEIYDEIIEYVRIVVKLMAEEGRPYKGILYAGVMLTEGGPRFLEFNCRFGDPETEVVAKNKVCSIFD